MVPVPGMTLRHAFGSTGRNPTLLQFAGDQRFIRRSSAKLNRWFPALAAQIFLAVMAFSDLIVF